MTSKNTRSAGPGSENRATCPAIRTIVALVALAAAAALAPTALAQTNVTAANKFAWQENCGWTNWRDAGSPVGTQGARIGATFLSGFVWGENIGWINLGDGTPAGGGGVGYANTDGADMGVNRDAGTGNLSGFAWGENVGRINFSGGALATPANPARFDAAAPGGGRLRGYAWGENIGWINLDHATHFVGVLGAPPCDGDVNCDGNLDGFDVQVMEAATGGDLTDFCQSDPDFNHDGNLDGFDVEAVEVVTGGGPCP